MSDCSDCRIDTRALQRRERRVLGTVLTINAATFLMMLAAVYISGSSALLSGALDNLGDALTYAASFAVVGATLRTKAKLALFKGLLIAGAACGVAIQLGWRLLHPAVPVVESMSIAALVNLAANAVCLAILAPYRHGDVNMASVWECSRNDVIEGLAVIAAAFAVWMLGSGWPDIIVALVLLVLFARSASRVLRAASRELRSPVTQA
ncbi:MAG: cation transporter [Planctomycetota bacterium]|nr:MAG: cation transporter [Planctomycetota bacterium]